MLLSPRTAQSRGVQSHACTQPSRRHCRDNPDHHQQCDAPHRLRSVEFRGRRVEHRSEHVVPGHIRSGYIRSGLAEPARTRFVYVGDDDRPVIADGPYGETQELLAGFRVLDCDSLERVAEIAAHIARCPAPDGAPVHPVVIRPVLDGGGDV